MRPGLTTGTLDPSIVSLNTNKSSSSSSSSSYDATALDIEVDPQRCRFGSRKSAFALQALIECRALEGK
jgi:hypothetical protein